MRRSAIALALLLAAPAALAQSMREDPRDIPYFERNHAERRSVLERCQRDVRLARTATCQNAERAGAGQLGRPLPKDWLPPEWRYPTRGPARAS